jgi:uronate dehydrogenase
MARPDERRNAGLGDAISDFSIALTGGSGNVGRALRKVLAPELAHIRVIDIVEPTDRAANESFRRTDIADLDALTAAFEGMDAVVHLAGYPGDMPIDEMLRVNAKGSWNVYEAARRAGVGRVVLGSSNHAMGFYPREQVVGSSDAMRPDGLYGLTKCWAELVAGLYYDKAGIKSLVIRIGNAAERPSHPRSLIIWISPRDLAQLVMIGLTHPDIDCTTVYGVSAGGGQWWDNSVAERLGYRPLDQIRSFATPEAFVAQPTRLPEISEFFQGGGACVGDHDGVRRLRRTP